MCFEDVQSPQEVPNNNEDSELLASSNQENENKFNPLKQSQILTKSDKPPAFAQTMPNSNAFKSTGQALSNGFDRLNTNPDLNSLSTHQSRQGRPPTTAKFADTNQRFGLTGGLTASEIKETEEEHQNESQNKAAEAGMNSVAPHHLHSSSMLPNKNNSCADMIMTPSFDPGSKGSGFNNSLQGSSMISELKNFSLKGLEKDQKGDASPSQFGESILNVKDGNLISPASQLTSHIRQGSDYHQFSSQA